jgi:hypothetical protein
MARTLRKKSHAELRPSASIMVSRPIKRTAGFSSTQGALHHVRKGAKGQEYEFTVEDGRGAVALLDASRNSRVNNFMSTADAARYGIEEEARANSHRVA